MKGLSIISILLTLMLVSVSVLAQEYDDIYFRKKDRQKIDSESRQNISLSEETEDLADETESRDYIYDDIPMSDDEYYGYDDPNYIDESEPYIIEKHYYYGRSSNAYRNNFDATFWNDPFLYQGAAFDPYYASHYRGPYYRPGWNVSFQFGYSSIGWQRWRYQSSYYWGSPAYWNYSWGGYYDPWNSNSYWCPPSSYYYPGVYVNSQSNSNRGVVRGRRTTRDWTDGSSYKDNPRGGRAGGLASDGKGRSGGRLQGDQFQKDGRNGRTESSADYSQFRSPTRNSNNSLNLNKRPNSPVRTNTTPVRPNSRTRNVTLPNNSSSGNQYDRVKSPSRPSNNYRPARNDNTNSGVRSNTRPSSSKSSSPKRTGRKGD